MEIGFLFLLHGIALTLVTVQRSCAAWFLEKCPISVDSDVNGLTWIISGGFKAIFMHAECQGTIIEELNEVWVIV